MYCKVSKSFLFNSTLSLFQCVLKIRCSFFRPSRAVVASFNELAPNSSHQFFFALGQFHKTFLTSKLRLHVYVSLMWGSWAFLQALGSSSNFVKNRTLVNSVKLQNSVYNILVHLTNRPQKNSNLYLFQNNFSLPPAIKFLVCLGIFFRLSFELKQQQRWKQWIHCCHDD